MDAEHAPWIIEALKEEKDRLYVTLPEEPTASFTQRRNKEPLAPAPPALRPSRPIEEWGFSSKRKEVHNSAGAAR